MKNIMNRISLLVAAMLAGVYTIAQESIYDYENKKLVKSFYNGPWAYLIFGAVIAFLVYIGYRYMHDDANE